MEFTTHYHTGHIKDKETKNKTKEPENGNQLVAYIYHTRRYTYTRKNQHSYNEKKNQTIGMHKGGIPFISLPTSMLVASTIYHTMFKLTSPCLSLFNQFPPAKRLSHSIFLDCFPLRIPMAFLFFFMPVFCFPSSTNTYITACCNIQFMQFVFDLVGWIDGKIVFGGTQQQRAQEEAIKQKLNVMMAIYRYDGIMVVVVGSWYAVGNN